MSRRLGIAALLLLAGCDRLDMYDQPRYEPLEASKFFPDGMSARPPVEGTVARGKLRKDEVFHTGKERGVFVTQFPEAVFRTIYDHHPARFRQPFEDTPQADVRRVMLERGRERFDIYCAVCHGRTGAGDGIIVRRGFRKPPSYQIERLRKAPNGHLFDVITRGFGEMASYANRVNAEDRWAIVAYIRALQLSQHAGLDDVPEEQRGSLPAPATPDAPVAPTQEPAP